MRHPDPARAECPRSRVLRRLRQCLSLGDDEVLHDLRSGAIATAGPPQDFACAYCGDINDGVRFCRACGRERPVEPPLAAGAAAAGPPPPPEGPRRRLRWVAIALAALAVAAVAALLLVVLEPFGDSKPAAVTTAPPQPPLVTVTVTTPVLPPVPEPPPPPPPPPATTVVPPPPPQAPALVALRTIAIAPLHVLDREDHCFGPAPRPGKRHVTLELGGTYRENVRGRAAGAPILVCGKSGDPSYATGTYRFGGAPLGRTRRLGMLTVRYGIDESGGQTQSGAQVSLSVTYYGKRLCESPFAGWRAPRVLSCNLKGVDRPADLSQLKIFQLVRGAAAPDAWAGLMSPRVVLLGPRA